jgi:hypothetical protein
VRIAGDKENQMQVIELGQLIADKPKRDAVHIAVVPVTLGGQAYPGEHVGLDRNGRASTLAPDVDWCDRSAFEGRAPACGIAGLDVPVPRLNEPASSRLVAPVYPG